VNDSSWVTSLGGPLILVPESACPSWDGAPPTYPDDEGDYGRACAVDDYIGLIDVGATQALVLGDHPARTTFLPERALLVRSIAADHDFDPEAALSELLPTLEWQEQLTWMITEPLILFDSVYGYSYVVSENEEHLRVELTPGRYLVEATYLEIPDEAYLILIRLTGSEAD
jgi:hypothetical protein